MRHCFAFEIADLYCSVGPVSEQRTILKRLQEKVAQAIAVKDEMKAAFDKLLQELHVVEVTGTSMLNHIHGTVSHAVCSIGEKQHADIYNRMIVPVVVTSVWW